MKQLLSVSLLPNSVNLLLAERKVEQIILKESVSQTLSVNDFFSGLTADDEKELGKKSNILRDTLIKMKVSDVETRVVLPDEVCSIQIIHLPLVSEKEIISAIELQAEEFIPYPIEKANFDYQILSIDEEHKEMSVLIIVMMKEYVDRIADFVMDIGLYPENLEPQSTAFFRYFMGDYQEYQSPLVMFLNIGRENTQASILNVKQKHLLTTYSFKIGINFFVNSLRHNLNLSYIQALEMFKVIKETDDNYLKILNPLFTEYSKEIQKILLSASSKLGTVPKQIFLNSEIGTLPFMPLFKNAPGLANYIISEIDLTKINSAKLALSQELQKTPQIDFMASACALI